ncbi:hypothetical protein JCM12296A_59260 [Desulfosarcina cetonica]|uniref:hypothetical protein n=1 Tax=Desulfosarcina cetonica TaxID=90730 RepID=UPI0012EE9669|nr:hypothetical protein [Desulfosarcina cetonica]
MKTDPDYKVSQKLSQQKWTTNHPGYWKSYREQYQEKTDRNRMLQTVRNRRRSTRNKPADVLIAKMDVTKVSIYTISDT